MLPYLDAAPTSTARSRSRSRRSMPPRRRTHAAALQQSRQINAVVGLVGGSDRLPRAVRLGAVPLAAVRQGPGLPRRPVGPDAGATARPDRRVRGHDHGRLHVTAGADDRDARPRVARADRVPPGRRRPVRDRRAQGRHRRQPGQGRRRRRGPAPAQRPPPDRAGRGARAQAARVARGRRGRGVHHARGPAQVRLGGARLRQGPREPRRRARLVRREAEQGRRAAGSVAASSRSSPA